ncbi:type I restriction-modification system subunit M/S [Streptomyces sp. CS131]|uniref:type I restriction-modification system subunit M/S n=1 Tax=Streptomyces sp. CS131 TaxID=2162711 RepID=UPI0013A5B4ED|nr:type I restriction-modification system subunit M/S [Streptomyces sp. CS131]
MKNTDEHEGTRLLTRMEIAGLAGVTRAAVTTWERRAADFPAPRRTSGQDYFLETEVLGWLDGRRVPTNRRTKGEDEFITYGVRARRRRASGSAPAQPQPAFLLPPGPGAREDLGSRDAEIVGNLMGPLAERVGGPDREVAYLNLLAALHFLHVTQPLSWKEVKDYATFSGHRRSSSDLLRLVGSKTDKALHAMGSLPETRDALVRLEPRRFEDIVEAVRLVGLLSPRAFQLIVEGYEEKARLGSREFFTPQPVAQLMAGLGLAARNTSATSAYDPYFRGGELLGAAVDMSVRAVSGNALDSAALPRLLGQTPKRATLPLASMSLALREARFALQLRAGGRPWERAWPPEPVDLVLTNPPFNMKDSLQETTRTGTWRYGAPPVGNDNFAYPQYALSVLAEGGRAAVVMPNKAGNSGNAAEEAIRRAMVEQGVVECVVALPDKLFSGTSVPVCVWLLRHPADAGDDVLFLDARDLGAVQRGGRRVLAGDDVRSVLDTYRALSGRGAVDLRDSHATAVPGTRVGREALHDAGYSLNPIDHMGGPAQRAVGQESRAAETAWTEVSSLTARCRQMEERTSQLQTRLNPDRVRRAPRRSATLAELCDIQLGPSHSLLAPKHRIPDGAVPVVSPKHIRDGRVSDTIDERVSWERAARLVPYRLEAGDIVCVRAGAMGPPAMVTGSQAGWLMSSNVIRLRCREGSGGLPDYLHAALGLPEAVGWVRDRAAATAAPFITKAALGRQEVLLPPLDVQAEIAALLVLLQERSALHRELSTALTHAKGLVLRQLSGMSSSSPSTV